MKTLGELVNCETCEAKDAEITALRVEQAQLTAENIHLREMTQDRYSPALIYALRERLEQQTSSVQSIIEEMKKAPDANCAEIEDWWKRLQQILIADDRPKT